MSRHRDSTTPMEYEYDNQTGPLDPGSPFITAAFPPTKKRKLKDFSSEAYAIGHISGQQLTTGPPFGQPGTQSVLNSPSKNAFSTPNRMQLREPNGEQYLFSQNKALGSIPPHVQNSKTWELRTPQSAVDFSSGGETPNTPAQDSDAATPDTQLASKMGNLSYDGDRKSPKKSKRLSIRKFFSGSPSPAKEDSRKLYSKNAENRVTKRRMKKAKTATREYDSDNEQGVSKDVYAQQTPPPLGFAANIPGVLAWVEAHPNLPAVLSYYIQFMVNAVLGIFFLCIIYYGYAAVMNDIDREAGVAARGIMQNIAICTSEYRKNRCEPDVRVPALEQACNQWELCMKQDAYKIARASVGARTFAMIFNSFVEEFSYKSMVFATFFFLLFFFGLRRLEYTAVRGVKRIQEAAVERQQMDAQATAHTQQQYQQMQFSQHQPITNPDTPLENEDTERTGFADEPLRE